MAEVIKATDKRLSKEQAEAAGIATGGDGITLSSDSIVVSGNPVTVRQPEQEEGRFVADRAYHLTKDGKVVEEDDPAGVKVLIGKGGSLSADEAAKYGLGQPADLAEHEEPEASEDLDSLKKAELVEIAEDKGLDVKSNMTKAKIIELIEGEEE